MAFDVVGEASKAASKEASKGVGQAKGVGDMLGLTDFGGAESARDNAAAYQKELGNFNKEQMAHIEKLYGGIEQNLSDYYKGLDPRKVASAGLQRQQAKHQQMITHINTNLAQRGLGNSKFEAYTNSMAEVNNANVRAQIEDNADEKVAKQQSGFLQLGLNQKSNIINAEQTRLNNAYKAETETANNKDKGNQEVVGDFAGMAMNAVMGAG